MRIGQITNLLVARYNNEKVRERAIMLIGPSGVGKSQVVWQAAEELGIDVVDLRLAQSDPTDIKGVPSVKAGRTVWNLPAWFPKPGTSGILFLDEITSAVPAIQAAAYQIVLDRVVSDTKLPDGWMVVTAGNRQSDRGVTYVMAAPLTNRQSIVDVDTTLEDFVAHASANDISPKVLAFVQARPEYLHQYNADTYGKQFPSPRSWFAVSDELEIDYDQQTRVDMIVSNVGKEAGISFEGFMRKYDVMPSLIKILDGDSDVDQPYDRDTEFCVAMGLAGRLTKANFNNAWKYIRHMGKEFQPLIIKMAVARDNDVRQATKFNEYIMANKDAFKR